MASTPLSLAQKIQAIRQSKGLTQQQLANLADVSLSTVTKLEIGSVSRPSAKTLLKIVKVLDFDLGELLSDRPLPKSIITTKTTKKTSSKIKFVYFDIGGVLVHTESVLFHALSTDLNRPADQIKGVYYQYIELACQGKLSLEEMQYLNLLKLNIKFEAKKRSKYFKHWVDYFEAIKPTHKFLQEIVKSYPVGLLTNTIDTFVERMQKNSLLPDIKLSALIKSSDVGVIKPDPKIYELATVEAGVKPAEIFFIDDRQINVKSAKEFGWQAEWFDEMHPEDSINRIRSKYF